MPAIEASQEKLRGIRGVSVPKEVHMTLRFLGDVEAKKINELSARMRTLEKHRPFSISVKGLGAFPNNREPRVVWIGAELGESFSGILSELDGILRSIPIEYDRKPFKAHITLGRVREPSKPLTDLLDSSKTLEAGSFVCNEILLMRSTLTTGGAVHSVIGTFPLEGNHSHIVDAEK
jgi:2'-5' RNA ligase